MELNQSLVGKNAVITGSSSGIGRATAILLAQCGANCLIHARANRTAAEQVIYEINNAGATAQLVMLDLTEEDATNRLVDQAYQWQEKIDIWINNAGADVLTGNNATLQFEQKLEQLWQVDLLSTVKLTRAVGKRMKQQAGGSIVNIGWDQATSGMAGDSGEMFSAIKGAIMAFTRSVAKSLAPEVRVNCVAPGWIKTSWAEDASQAWQQRAVDESLLKRWGTPEDVARAIRFLVSDDAAFITAEILQINGGFDG